MDNLIGEPMWIALFGAACYLLTLVVRRIVETAQPHLKEKPYKTSFSRWWNQVILYLIPLIFGAVLALLLKGTSLIPAWVDSYRTASVYGVVLGSMSSMMYKVLKMLFLRKAGVGGELKMEDLIEEPPDTKRE